MDFSGVIDPALLALSHPTHNNNHSANDDDPTSLFVEDTESNPSSINNLPADDDYDDYDNDNDNDNDYDDTSSSDLPETEADQSSTNNFPADADAEEADNSIEESDDDSIPVKKRKISGK